MNIYFIVRFLPFFRNPWLDLLESLFGLFWIKC